MVSERNESPPAFRANALESRRNEMNKKTPFANAGRSLTLLLSFELCNGLDLVKYPDRIHLWRGVPGERRQPLRWDPGAAESFRQRRSGA